MGRDLLLSGERARAVSGTRCGTRRYQDIEHWRDYVTVPDPVMPAEAWEETIRQVEAIDRNEIFRGPLRRPGVFEQATISWKSPTA